MFDVQKLQQLRQVAKSPSESDYVRALVTILVELEHRQLERIEALHDALDIDGIDVQSTREDREQQLLDLAEHVAQGEFTEWWFDEVVAQHVENADDARPYADLDSGEWEEQIETWADQWRGRAPEQMEDKSDRDIARLHVERKFGVSLGEFEREVVQYSRKDALRTVLAGNFEAVEAGIQAATAEVSKRGEDDE